MCWEDRESTGSETIYRAGKITLEQINRKWVENYLFDGQPMVRSTFNRHKDAIQDMFGIDIEDDRKDGFRYYIGNADLYLAIFVLQ